LFDPAIIKPIAKDAASPVTAELVYKTLFIVSNRSSLSEAKPRSPIPRQAP